MKITIGRPIANTQIYIVDNYMNLMPIGITGELCIAGDGVGAGYLNRPELTAEKFIDNPFGEGKLYKTGDLAYWREDGNIAFVGRNDFQVKIRGLRIELGEIENVICSVAGINHAVVVVRKDDTGRQLICAFYTESSHVETAEIKRAISDRLPKYMMPHIFTLLSEMPLTPSGKINRKALPDVDLQNIESTVEYVAPITEQECILCSTIAAVLHIDKVGTEDNFFDLGGDSLKAIELISRLEVSGLKTTVKTVFDCDTVKDLAGQLEMSHSNAEAEFLYPAEIPATAAQMRVYTSQSMNIGSTTYNVPYAFRAKEVNVEKLQKAINGLLDRHEILRTFFENKDGTIIQTVDQNAVCEVEQLASDDISKFVRPFDLSKAPLVRVGVCKDTVMIDMHHIITDGGSMPVFLRELNELYMGRTLESETVPYKRFAVTPQEYAERESYWLDVFKDDVPELTINTDFKRGTKQSFNGSALYDKIDIRLHSRIQEFCKKQNITPFVFYMAGFNILLSNFSGCEDIVVGMPVSGRSGDYLQTIGMFVNTVALRSKPVGTKSVKDFLQEVKESSIAAISHQSYPFGDLVKKLELHTADRNPLFDVMFAYQSEQMTDVTFGDEKATVLPIPITASKYDLTFNIMPNADGTVVMVEYCSDLYQEATVQRFVDGYRQILKQMMTEDTLCTVSAVLPDEREKILLDFNDTARRYPTDNCIHELIEHRVANYSQAQAVIAEDKTLTYGELNAEANRIAHSLISENIAKGDIVAVILPRKSNLISAILGVLKTGAAYMPIDPSYPQERIDYLLSESRATFCITEDNIEKLCTNTRSDNPRISVSMSDYFCALHTSGSTGKPKLAVLTQQNLLNFLYSNEPFWDDVETVICVTIVTFDTFMQDTLLSLSLGKKVVLASNNQIYNQAEFEKMFETEDNVMLFSTPTKLLSYIKGSENAAFLYKIRSLIVGGEVFPDELYNLIVEKFGLDCCRNGYGPAETTIGVSYTDKLTPPPPQKASRTRIRIYNGYGPTETTLGAVFSCICLSNQRKHPT